MLIKKSFASLLLLKTSFVCLFVAFYSSSEAQIVWQTPGSEVYRFLSRQAQKGNIHFEDVLQPVSRKAIAQHLNTLQDSVLNLSSAERAELKFYLQEFSEFNTPPRDTLLFLKKDLAERWRFLSVNKDGFLLRGDPLITAGFAGGNGSSVLTRGNGITFWGHAGKNLTFQGSFQDITERGTGIDSLRDFTSKEGIVRTVTLNSNSVNYSRLKGHVTYSWNNGSVSIGKDQLLLGYGENGRIILSDKAPAYPLIRIDYKPLKWLQFQYSHLWLHSGMIDSAKNYNKGNGVYSSNREFYIPKFMATHSLNLYPLKGLSLTIGESMVYSDRLNIAYLIPIMFFKAFDQYESKYNVPTGSNGQFFFQASSRNHIPKTHLYSTLFIDEIRTSTIFNRQKSRNQLGYNIGASVTDIVVPYLTLGSEYTRINPFAYQNLIPAQTYSSQGYSLGDWMGNNADRFLVFVKYTPLPRLKTELQLQKIRKGGPGRVEDQYFAEPQPSFLFDMQKDFTESQFKVSYEWINNLHLQGIYTRIKERNIPAATNRSISRFDFSINFGL